MAQDKRHDLAPHALRYWNDKLKGIPDRLICKALKQGRWAWFPSVDDVLELVAFIREHQGQDDLPRFTPCGECDFGWKYQVKDGKRTGRVEACVCRLKWESLCKNS